MPKLKITSTTLILLVSFFITLANNQVLFSKAIQRLDVFSLQGGGYVATLFTIIFLALCSFLFIFGQRYLLKPLIIILLLLSATLSYFGQQLGVIFDEDMIRNISETVKDNNQQEATELLSLSLFKHVFIYGIVPSLLVLWANVSYKLFFKENIKRMVYLLVLLAISTSLVMMNFKYTSYFSRENRDLRFHITPLYAIDATWWFFKDEREKNTKPFMILGEDAVQTKRQPPQRTIGIMAVGEAARADHFSLNGYSRETNPKLKKEQLINYSQATACGTSTAFSVPCMFSFLNRDDYSVSRAALQSNSLDVLVNAGVKVVWLDNNSSCKGVCDRIGEINLRHKPDKNSPFYAHGEVFDEALIIEMDKILKTQADDQDILFVLHTLGSHGPKYYKRYPDEFSQFEPACKKATPQECTDAEIINAYDNTILYTDHVLSQIIEFLKAQSNAQSFMIYASDHGESLGENGVYLHGLPYFLAPDAQTQIPMLIWLSDSYLSRQALDTKQLQQRQLSSDISHDNLSHSLLGAFNVKSKAYKQKYDLLNRD